MANGILSFPNYKPNVFAAMPSITVLANFEQASKDVLTTAPMLCDPNSTRAERMGVAWHFEVGQ